MEHACTFAYSFLYLRIYWHLIKYQASSLWFIACTASWLENCARKCVPEKTGKQFSLAIQWAAFGRAVREQERQLLLELTHLPGVSSKLTGTRERRRKWKKKPACCHLVEGAVVSAFELPVKGFSYMSKCFEKQRRISSCLDRWRADENQAHCTGRLIWSNILTFRH